MVNKLSAEDRKHVSTFRSLQDYAALRALVESGRKTITVIGGGFLGSELACAISQKAAKRDVKVVQVFPEEGNMAAVLPAYLTKWTSDKMKQRRLLLVVYILN